MFFVPVAILVIEDEDDRTFMENLYSSYHRLMYHTIHLITEDPWITEDILQSTTEKLIQNLDTIKHLPQPKLVNYIKTASTNTTYTYLRKRNLDPYYKTADRNTGQLFSLFLPLILCSNI